MELDKKIIRFLEEFLTEELEEPIKLTLDSKLFGGGGPLDSMSLVNLLVDLEELIEEDFGISITLADEKAMSRRTSPFSRVKYLVGYIEERINTSPNE
jgi:acyl carrier protein